MTLQEVELYNRMVLAGRKPPKPTADDRERVVHDLQHAIRLAGIKKEIVL